MPITAAQQAEMHRDYERLWNEGALELVDKHLTDDFVEHAPVPGLPDGKAGARELVRMWREAFPDVQFKIEDDIAQYDRVVHRWSMVQTHTGPFMGIPPTGKRCTFTGITIFRVNDQGKIVERWAEISMLELLTQLGVVPSPGGPPPQS